MTEDLLAQITQKANENSKTPIIPKTIIPTPIPPPKTEEKKPEVKKKESDPDPLQKEGYNTIHKSGIY